MQKLNVDTIAGKVTSCRRDKKQTLWPLILKSQSYYTGSLIKILSSMLEI